MSKIRRASVVLLANTTLLALVSLLQAADNPPEKPPEAKENKQPAPANAAPPPAAPAVKIEAVPVIVGGGPAIGVKVAQPPMKAVGGPVRAVLQNPGAPSTGGEFTDAITLPTDRQSKKILELAEEDYIKNEAWTETCRLLQSILNKQEDVFVQVRRKGADNQEQVRWVSARAEANRLLGTMPSKGLDYYELQYGGQAKKLLTEAKKAGDTQLLASVAQRYFHTEAGAEATDLLGTYHLDRGRALMAALCYERLLRREGADQLAPLTLFKAALAFRLSGAPSSTKDAGDIWKRLVARAGRDGVRVGDETVALDDLRKDLDRAIPAETSSPYDWAMFRGNPSRSAKGRGSAPFLESKWQKSLLAEPLTADAKRWVEDARKRPPYRPAPLLPAFYPIAAAGKLIFRDYSKIQAVDIKTGEVQWESVKLLAALEALANEPETRRQAQDWLQTYGQVGCQNILFENSTIGTLSCDNSRVYAVDDMAIPPYPNSQMAQMWGGGWQGQAAMNQKLAELSQRSRLVALDLETGRIVWERGDPNYDKTELAGSYFLGPPLPLGGKLYVLTEKNGELRLVCLDAAKGEVHWAQTLATAREKLSLDVSRRVQAVHLAYAEGILVCPTNAGAILGVDLLSRSLVWAFPYREKSGEAEAGNREVPRVPRRAFPPGMMVQQDWTGSLQKLSEDWKMSAPVIQDGKVVFTAPDGGSIHCLNLQDGASLWQADRRDDLYLAGVFQGQVVLVGKNVCRALSLADGKHQLWQVETGMPSGQGVASGSNYYLPLKKGAVAMIDMEKKVVATSLSPKDEVPGNLLFYEGDVICQSETTVTAYEQVDAKVAQIDVLLKKNPHDPTALAERGELRLYKGDLAGAVTDLREAASNTPRAAALTKVRSKLYATLTELLQHDFNAAEQYLEEYKALCNIPVPTDASAEERQKLQEEQRKRRAGFLCLLAKGRESQGRVLEAFQAYLDFSALAESKELVSVINEPAVKARPDVWAQGRIAALVAKATPEQRKPLEEEIAKHWKTVQASKDSKALPQFVAEFGSLFAQGREARLLLAERLMGEGAYVEAELQLLPLRRQRDDPAMAARAVEALARLMTRRGLLEDAAYYYRILNRDYPEVVIRDGKTGADLYRELATDKRFLPYLDESVSPFSGGTVKATEIPEGSMMIHQLWPFEEAGEEIPFFQHNRLAWMVGVQATNAFHLKLLDRDTNQERWTFAGPSTRVLPQYSGGANGLRFPCRTEGRFAVLCLGHTIYGLDLAARKKLWERELLAPDRFMLDQPGVAAYILTLDAEGGLLLQDPQGHKELLGQLGPVTASFVCLRTTEGLVALDTMSGTVLWKKSDISSNTRIFGDDRYVYLIDVRDGGHVGSGRAVRGQDGATVDVPDFAAEYQRRQRIVAGRLLISEADTAGGTTLRLYDIPTGKNLWKKVLAAKSVVLRTEQPELAAMVEPDGKLTVVDLRIQKEIFHAAVSPAHLEKVVDGLVLRDSKRYYAILNQPGDPNNLVYGPNVSGMRCATANGMVYAFDRESGKLGWYVHVPHQMVLLEQFGELPMLVFTARYHKPVNNPGNFTPVSATLSIDKRTGKRLYDNESPGYTMQQPGPFHSLIIDRQGGTIDLVSHQMRLRHYVGENNAKVGLGGGAEPKRVAAASAAPAPEPRREGNLPARVMKVNRSAN
jgi:outer membrane protein assembly factor BamB